MLGLTVGELHMKVSKGRDFRKSKENFSEEYAYAKVEQFALAGRVEGKGEVG